MDNSTNTELENFMHNVAWLRRHNGLSKKEMAHLLGISVWSLNKLERGQFPPQLTVEVLERIHALFSVPRWLLFASRFPERELGQNTE